MLQITIPSGEIELFDEAKNEFLYAKSKGQVLQLEHSLVSLSKWESKWKKPFLSNKDKTREETIDYVRCMTITQNVDPDVYNFLTDDHIDEVNKYIDDKMTATTFRQNEPPKTNREVITAEIIYYWMIAYNIPFECQKWHLNRLLTLINVCNIKNQKPKKMSKAEFKSEVARRNAINEARKAQINTTG